MTGSLAAASHATGNLTGVELVIEQADTDGYVDPGYVDPGYFEAGQGLTATATAVGVLTGAELIPQTGALTGMTGSDSPATLTGIELTIQQCVFDVIAASERDELQGIELLVEPGILEGVSVGAEGASATLTGVEIALQLGALTGTAVDSSTVAAALTGIELALQPGALTGTTTGGVMAALLGRQANVEIGVLAGVAQSSLALHSSLHMSILPPAESLALLPETHTIKLLEGTMSQTIWLGRDNTIDMALMDKATPQEADAVTSWSFHLYPQTGGQSLSFTTALHPTVFDTTASMLVGSVTVSILRLKLGHQTIGAGEYMARIVGYDAGHVNGFMWGEFLVRAKAS